MNIEWLPIFLSALSSGLLGLVISHFYHRISLNSADRRHMAQLQATAERHAEQMDRMTNHHAEQLLVMRTTLLAVERDSGVKAARDDEGKLTGGLHHAGEFIAVPDVSASAVAGAREAPQADEVKSTAHKNEGSAPAPKPS